MGGGTPDSPSNLTKETADVLTDGKFSFIEEGERQKLAHRDRAFWFILWVYAGVLVATFGIIFLQGFSVGGFKLDQAFLNWLGGATITEVAAIAALVFRAIFGGSFSAKSPPAAKAPHRSLPEAKAPAKPDSPSKARGRPARR